MDLANLGPDEVLILLVLVLLAYCWVADLAAALFHDR